MSIKSYVQNNITGKRRTKIAAYCTVPIFIMICLFFMEYLNFTEAEIVLEHWNQNMHKLWFALIIMTLLSAFFILLAKKLWIFSVALGSVSVISGLVNRLKVAANGDNFMPWDITMASQTGALAGFAKFTLPTLTIPLIVLIVLFCLFYSVSGCELPVRWFYRIPSVLLLCVLFSVCYNIPDTTEKILNKFSMSFNDSILQSSNYSSNGFVNAFTLNCFALKVVEPEGYGKTAVEAIMNPHSAVSKADTATALQPDVIVIMSEAFFDVRTLNGTEFSSNPLSNFERLSASSNAYSGSMYTTAFGGGTVRTEFELLTGLTIDYLANSTSPYLYVNKKLESYVSNYKAQGYKTVGIHPYDPTFYMRNRAYPNLGFDLFISQNEISLRDDLRYRRGFITDDTFVNTVIDTLESDPDEPQFVFGITMENHGAYDKSEPDEIEIGVTNDLLSEELLDSVTTYTQGVYYSDLALGRLADYIDLRERDTVLLYFGDHLPTLGASQGAYNECGNVDISDGYDEQERKFLYSTPFLCYANYDSIDYSVFNSHHEISCYYMLSLLASATKSKMTPYMNYLADSFDDLPYYNVRLRLSLNEKAESFINSMKLVTYDRLKGNGYSVSK